jgi:hypothetical protein
MKMDEENLRKITKLRHELHSLAELSMHETKTKARLMQFIRENTDFTVHDCDQWFWCRKDREEESGMTPIAFRADMDALPIDEQLDLPYASLTPGVSHKCGHDGHCAVLAGLALELTGAKLRRPVVLIFQPGEEIGAGGKMCAQLIPELRIGGDLCISQSERISGEKYRREKGIDAAGFQGADGALHGSGKPCQLSGTGPESGVGCGRSADGYPGDSCDAA